MKTSLLINLKNQNVISCEVTVKKTSFTLLKVQDMLENNFPLFLEIEHRQTNTLLELTKVKPCVLLYFDESHLFTGASYSINEQESIFSISTQAKQILLLSYPISFELSEVSNLKLNF